MRIGHFPTGAPPLPLTPGWDLAGTVTAVGEGVIDIAVGDQVIAGVLRTRVARVLPLHEAPLAHRLSAGGGLKGKVVLSPSGAVLH